MDGVLVITGGSRGIGRATALKAAAAGYRVVVNYTSDAAAADAVVSAIAQAGGTAMAVQGDVANEADVIRLFAEADAFGPLSGLVNNAGVIDRAMSLVDMSAERITRLMMVNVVGSLIAAREAVRRLSTQFGGKGGVIVNLSSRAAELGGAKQYVDYAATKGAIDSLTRGLALEVADQGIRVAGVRPGIIETDIHASAGDPGRAARMGSTLPMGRAGSADEVADAILWLLSDKASYVTGTTIDVSGGR
ncbi:SDR family oxidoreductase [Chelatococcus asaccharovorans]|uniref:NAD(P)-dependent dehydrogenase (Short-subunit alcohol dehydrogenase family) n=1 Tax=Chelatococcus asaccharovorans TaxID=28210 RepID=A0A2V3U8C1_9HYPH|nr:SDR family oxidoreductase [Chelatococcus asaccharovorans]MBS7706014.1 SDR family oxidoreductase [Chelatococcus asaccharovorans]PXW59036.1 NAD(P)-dependent dehydrogenase (short-subunit alcohol dehydrogenase family) [Chelatococcus asaccharovorans]